MASFWPYDTIPGAGARRGHRVSFVSTPRNIDRLPKLPSSLIPFISFVKLPAPQVPDLPENAEATTDVPLNKVQFLKVANDLLQQPMARFLVRLRIGCFMILLLICWAPLPPNSAFLALTSVHSMPLQWVSSTPVAKRIVRWRSISRFLPNGCPSLQR